MDMQHAPAVVEGPPRHDWSLAEALTLYELPFLDLVMRAQQLHRAHFPKNQIQISQLLSIKTGGCAEDCAYCPQSAHHETGKHVDKLMSVDQVLREAQKARDGGASRYCLGAAWRSPKDADLDAVCEMVKGIKGLGLEACVTLGMLTDAQAQRLKHAGLDYYNHNIDTSPEYYPTIITTRTFHDRLETLRAVRGAGLHVCCGGIVGMGESREDRAKMLVVLATMQPHPESVPINRLVAVQGTPGVGLAQAGAVDGIEMVRTIAVARILMPTSVVRLSAGRETMSDELHALAFLAGANSIFAGDKLLTTKNPGKNRDARLFETLGLSPWVSSAEPSALPSAASSTTPTQAPAAAE